MSEATGAWTGKVDQRLHALVARAGSGGESAREVSVFVRFTGAPEDLIGLGLAVRSVAGDIATASIRIADIPAAAASPSVVLVELARPLGRDAGSWRE